MRARASLWSLIALVGCGPKLPPLPSAGGPPWIELTTAHFQFFTDSPEARAREVVQEMEQVRSVIYGAVFPDQPPGGQTIVISMRSLRESSMFTWPDHTAFAMPSRHSPLSQPIVVMATDAYGYDEARISGAGVTAIHELAHALSDNAIHDQPPWFAEGLATYFQSLKIEGHDVELGRPPSDIADSLSRGLWSLWPIANVFSCHDMDCRDWVFYERAWALFSYLRNQHPRELVQLGQQLGQTIDDKTRVATWNQLFPALPISRLDRAVGDWLLSGDLSVWHYKLEARTWPVEVRTLADSEVLSLRALLWMLRDRKSPEVERNLAAALAQDPNDLLGNYLAAANLSVDHATAIVRLHPKSWMAWWLLASALPLGPQWEVARTTMCDLSARDPAIERLSTCSGTVGNAVITRLPTEATGAPSWEDFWRSHGVTPAPPRDAFEPSVPPDLEVRNLTSGRISDDTARRWVLGDLRRGAADRWTFLNLRKDIADAGVLGPPGLNGTAAAIGAQRAKGAVRLTGTSIPPVVAAVIAVPPDMQREDISAGLTDFVVVLVFRSTGTSDGERIHADGTVETLQDHSNPGDLKWQLDTGEFRDDPVVGPLWYQAMGWTCVPGGQRPVARLCALVQPGSASPKTGASVKPQNAP